MLNTFSQAVLSAFRTPLPGRGHLMLRCAEVKSLRGGVLHVVAAFVSTAPHIGACLDNGHSASTLPIARKCAQMLCNQKERCVCVRLVGITPGFWTQLVSKLGNKLFLRGAQGSERIG
jgi:hypothetical protein